MRFFSIWRRNFLVWKKLAIPSMLGNLADPALYMLGLGYGLGNLLPQVQGMPYMSFLAAGTLCYSTMNSATFEALYSAFSRMHVQKTWEGILNAPMSLADVLLGEWFWAASKSLLSGFAIFLIMVFMGIAGPWELVWILPVIVAMGLCFAGMGLVMNALAPNYDFFMYYFTLLVTPMVLLSGVFYPVSEMPPLLQELAAYLPLTHGIALVRPVIQGLVPEGYLFHLAVLLAYGGSGFALALLLTRRRLLR